MDDIIIRGLKLPKTGYKTIDIHANGIAYDMGEDTIHIIENAAQPEIIRCKNCKFSVDEYEDGDCYCKRPNRALEWIGDWDFFCADGAKMGVENEID